jgi:hypothetical protein
VCLFYRSTQFLVNQVETLQKQEGTEENHHHGCTCLQEEVTLSWLLFNHSEHLRPYVGVGGKKFHKLREGGWVNEGYRLLLQIVRHQQVDVFQASIVRVLVHEQMVLFVSLLVWDHVDVLVLGTVWYDKNVSERSIAIVGSLIRFVVHHYRFVFQIVPEAECGWCACVKHLKIFNVCV